MTLGGYAYHEEFFEGCGFFMNIIYEHVVGVFTHTLRSSFKTVGPCTYLEEFFKGSNGLVLTLRSFLKALGVFTHSLRSSSKTVGALYVL